MPHSRFDRGGGTKGGPGACDGDAHIWVCDLMSVFVVRTQGLPPFYDEDAKKAYQKLLTCPIEFPPTVSYAAQSLIRGLLMTDPSKRLGARLNAQEQQNQHKIIAASWGDGMPIKRHEWFKCLHWDEV